jgi:hypothetical protein
MKKQKFLSKTDDFKKDESAIYIGIVGSTTIKDKQAVFKFISDFIRDYDDKKIVFVSGGAKGVDSFAEKFASINNIDMIVILPDWKKYGKAAGPVRNNEIVKLSDLLLAVVDKDYGGSWDSIKKAQKKNIPVKIINIAKAN